MIKRYISLLSIIFFLIGVDTSIAQFYNGHQMTFGKNRVQYRDFYWRYYRFDRFDAYFHDNSENLAAYTSKTAMKTILEVESFFGYSFQKRIILIIYDRMSDYKQSNIGLETERDEYNTGGMMKIIDNKVFLYYEGDHNDYKQQLKSAITEILLTEMIYGGNVREKLTSSTLLNMPEWYIKGLISYVSNNWDFKIDDNVRDGILSGRYEKFNRLTGKDAVYAGQSIWHYIAKTYGKEVIPNIVYMAKVNKNAASGFLFVLGRSLKDLTPEWMDYYKTRYENDVEGKHFPDSVKILKKTRKKRVYQNICMSPDGKHVAYTTNNHGKYKIWIHNLVTGKKRKIYKRGYKLNQVTDYSYPVLAWHPSGDILSFVTEEKGRLFLTSYQTEKKEYNKRLMLNYSKILDISYSHDGLKLVISGVQENLIDIYVFTFVSGVSERLTHDLADDMHPRFIENSGKILFSSNRKTDTLKVEEGYHYQETGRTYDLYVYDYKNRSRVVTKITETPFKNEIRPVELTSDIYTYLSDDNGIYNRHIAKYDSAISFIDTTTHYRYFSKSYPLTNYSRNINSHDVILRKKKFSEILFRDGKFYLFFNNLDTKRGSYEGEYENTYFRNELTSKWIEEDSVKARLKRSREKKKQLQEQKMKKEEKKKPEPPPKIDPDSMIIDINNYVFEREKYKDYYQSLLRDSIKEKKKKKTGFEVPVKRIYQTAFYTNYLVNQVDFGFLNSSYQAYTGGPFYFNPGFNVLFKVGINDLFEDYKVVGGVRFAGNFDSNEYLLSFEDLKSRWDKQIIFHRQVFKRSDAENFIQKVTSQELMYILKFPFNQISALQGTANLRYDRTTYLSIDYYSLRKPDLYKLWGGLKLEYIFDNSRQLGLNLYEGTRSKIFFEAFKQLDQERSDLFVAGLDFRHYIRIHRNLIWANRFAASTSFGGSKLVYYLGGVDNWINYPGGSQIFDYSTGINEQQNYVYQAVATNLRGFKQNVRNGNTFMLANSEIRWPLFRYFANRPINSDFLNNFQIVGFADVGTAFAGPSPNSEKNSYNRETITRQPVTMIIDNEKDPIVGGFGFGLRSRLFGYFIRTDWAWGIEGGEVQPRVFYLSLSLDF
jgi:hypothetical protein